MSNATTIKLLLLFFQAFAPTSFFTGMFAVTPDSFYDSEFIEIDIERSDEAMAIVIENISAGYRDNAADIYTNKRYKSPVFKEKAPLNAFDLMSRELGVNPFMDPDFQANASKRAMKLLTKMANKIRRAMEYQAAQIMQTGSFTYIDAAGATLFTMNFSPKTSHFTTVPLAWSNVASDPGNDIQVLANQIRKDSGVRPDRLIMGESAFRDFLNNPKVLATLDNRRLELGGFTGPSQMGEGQTFQGVFSAGNFKFDVFTYDATFNPVNAPTTKVSYMTTDKVIITSSKIRLDAAFGGIPRFAAPNANVLPYLPSIQDAGRGASFETFAYLNDDATALNVAIASRPLFIPTQIDGFGALDVTP